MNTTFTTKKSDLHDQDPNWIRRLIVVLLQCIVFFTFILAPILIWDILPIPVVYQVSSDEIINANISSRGDVQLNFIHNTISKVEKNDSNYKVISNKKQKDYGSIIKLNHNFQHNQDSKISFIDNNGKVIDINFTSSIIGANFVIINDHNSPNYSPHDNNKDYISLYNNNYISPWIILILWTFLPRKKQ